jgi:hypothetical protein
MTSKQAAPMAVAFLAFGLGLAAMPAAAQGVAFRAWGVRAGIADDPDQGVAGVQIDLGELVKNLHWQPRIELGLGDDTTTLTATLPLLYRAPLAGRLHLYGGGGLTFGLIDRDRPRRGQDDSELEIAPMAAGGLAWPVGQSEASLELALTAGDFSEAKLTFGWMF